MNERIRIRQKGKGYFVIEKIVDNKILKSLTLNPEKTWELLMCQGEKGANVSRKDVKNKENQDQKVAQSLLSEQPKGTKDMTLHEQINNVLKEILPPINKEQMENIE